MAKKTKDPQKVKIVTKPSVKETLLSLPLNKEIKFSTRDFKTPAVRQCVTALRKKGHDFKVTEAGMVDEFIVTKTK